MPKIPKEDLLLKEPYKSILNLLSRFQLYGREEIDMEAHSPIFYALNREKTDVKGLTHGQILYALNKNPPKDKEKESFFGDTLKEMTGKKRYKAKNRTYKIPSSMYPIERRGISSSRLQEKLALLREKGLIERDGKHKSYTYFLTGNYYLYSDIRNIKQTLDRCDNSNTMNSSPLYSLLYALAQSKHNNKIPFPTSNDLSAKFLIWGFPLEIIIKLSENEIELLYKSLRKIEVSIEKIMEIKKSKTNVNIKEYFEKSLEDNLKMHQFGFCYSGYIFPNVRDE